EFAKVSANRRIVFHRVIQHRPGNLRGDYTVAYHREAEILPGMERPAENIDHHIELLVIEQAGLAHRVVDAVTFDGRVLEVMAHPAYALGSYDVDVAVVRFFGSQVAVDKPLGDVEHHAVLERAMHLHPPRI